MRKQYPLPRFILVCSLLLARPVSAQFHQQGPKLVAFDAIGAASQGVSVSISADGNTAIVGASGDQDHVGAAWVWIRVGDAWLQQAKLVGSGAEGSAYQGSSTSLSADGNTAIVGGWSDSSGKGAAWVWTRSAGVWTQQGPKLVGSGAAGAAHQGQSVALSADGNTAIAGGPYDDTNVGAAWVWTRSGGVWTQQGSKLITVDAGDYSYQGWSVALSADSNTALIGSGNIGTGTPSVWIRSGGVWTQQGPSLAADDYQQGWSVALSADGNTALVGGFDFYVWVWTRGSESWDQQGPRLANPTGFRFGDSVSLSADGKTALIGGRYDGFVSASEGAPGCAWIFTENGGVWYPLFNKLVGSGAVGHAYQGTSVALSGDGKTAIVGGPSDNLGTGAVWVYERDPSPPPVRRRSARP